MISLKPLKWYPTLDQCAQLSHFALALAFVWGPVALLQVSPWWGIGFTLMFAGIKEFVFDTLAEHDSQTNNWIDFAFYLSGAAVAGIACLLAGRF